jgi:hypothetical protein
LGLRSPWPGDLVTSARRAWHYVRDCWAGAPWIPFRRRITVMLLTLTAVWGFLFLQLLVLHR